MRSMLFIFLLLISQNILSAQIDKFNEANEHYTNGDYNSAIVLYEELLEQNYSSVELYYNLGNAYFKSDLIPNAILNYERALRLDPGNEDIEFNLTIANLQTVDQIEPIPVLFFYEWYDSLVSMFSSIVWSYITIVFMWVAVGFMIGFLFIHSGFVKKIMFLLSIVSIAGTIITLVFAFQSFSEETAKDEAIIFAKSVYIKSSPSEKGTDLFILHEGTKVKLIDKVNEWLEIRLNDGNVGWIKTNDLKII